MKKGLLGIAMAVMAVALVAPTQAIAAQWGAMPPPIGRNQGWLSVTNRDDETYTIAVERKGRAAVYRGNTQYPGMQSAVVYPGATVTMALEKDTWEFRGDGNDKLKVKVREGRTSTLVLQPFGNSGLQGVSNDGDRVRNEVLFQEYYAPPVVVERPIVVPAPAPPPIIVNRPPVIVHQPRPRPPAYRPPPPPPPRYGHRNDGWGFSFGYNSGGSRW